MRGKVTSLRSMITRLRIAGMTSVHAVRAVSTGLSAVEGITALDVRLGTATIEHDGRATRSMLREAIALAGYEVTECVEEARRLPVV